MGTMHPRTLASGLSAVAAALIVGACSVFGGKAAEEPLTGSCIADGDIETTAHDAHLAEASLRDAAARISDSIAADTLCD